MGLLETMKQVAQATNDAGMPTAFLFGSVTKTSPLTIRVDNRFDISGDAIVVMKEFQAGFYPTHYHTGVKGSPSTEEKSGGSGDASFAAHSHTLKSNYQTNTDAKSEYYYGLAVGDKVVLLRKTWRFRPPPKRRQEHSKSTSTPAASVASVMKRKP